jgi:hypothetical protein
MNHRIGRSIFALVVGLTAAFLAFQWISNPAPRAERAQEEHVVRVSRLLLADLLASDGLEIVDPLAPNRRVGKVYVYAEPPGWAVSGYYRRGKEDGWHPFLMNVTENFELRRLKVRDEALADRAVADPRLEVRP